MRAFRVASAVALFLAVIYLASFTEASCKCGTRIRVRGISQLDSSLPGGGENLCWLVAATMAKRWELKDNSISIESVARWGKEEARYKNGNPLPARKHNAFLDAIGMTNFQISPQPEAMCDLIKTYGPIYVGKANAGNVGRHIVLITALSGSCKSNGKGTTVVGVDPWTGRTYRKKWLEFMDEWSFAQSADIANNPAALGHFKHTRKDKKCTTFNCPTGFAKKQVSNSNPYCRRDECVQKCCEPTPIPCSEYTCPEDYNPRQESIPGECTGDECTEKCCEANSSKA